MVDETTYGWRLSAAMVCDFCFLMDLRDAGVMENIDILDMASTYIMQRDDGHKDVLLPLSIKLLEAIVRTKRDGSKMISVWKEPGKRRYVTGEGMPK